MTTTTYGDQYHATKNEDIRDIAKRVRKDIKAAIKSGRLPAIKTSVRIDRYSMGQSLDVTITEAPFLVINPKRLAVDMKAGGRYVEYDEETISWLSTNAREVMATIESIVSAYNFDGSDSMTDYYHVRFSSDVSYSSEITTRQREHARGLISRGITVKEKAA